MRGSLAPGLLCVICPAIILAISNVDRFQTVALWSIDEFVRFWTIHRNRANWGDRANGKKPGCGGGKPGLSQRWRLMASDSEPRRAPPPAPIQPSIGSGVPKAEAPGTVAGASQREECRICIHWLDAAARWLSLGREQGVVLRTRSQPSFRRHSQEASP